MKRRKKKGRKKDKTVGVWASGDSIFSIEATFYTDSPSNDVREILEEPLAYFNERFGTNHRLKIHNSVKEQ